MKTFVMLILCSFWAGIAISYIPFYRQSNHRMQADFLKGALVALAALLLVGTPMALVAAGSGLLFATRCFPFPRDREIKIYGMAAGLLLFMVPDLFLLALLWCLILGLLLRDFSEQYLASFFLILPLLMFLADKSDVYILFSVALFVVVLMDNFVQLETGARTFMFSGKAVTGTLTGKNTARHAFVASELKNGNYAGINFETRSETGILSPIWSRRLRRSTYVLVILLLVFAFFLNRYVYKGFGMQVELFRKGPPDADVVAITFDDGPDPRFTPAILKILQEEDVKATFFMVGKHAEKYPDLARQVAAAGHEIGNHTYAHTNLLRAPRWRIAAEIKRGEEAIYEATGLRPSLFRPPRGLYEAKLMEETKERGYTVVLWSLSSNDWLEMRPVDISRTILQNITPGDILLFHDSGDIIRSEGGERLPTVRSLKTVIAGLKKQGYDFVTVTELLILSGLSGDL
ncbi:MAG: polysaccharide deacetylase family protein [Firmicutes bacterium]|nr:polysaccharide deacetylase family protein [Bacillota bacterium]